MRLQRMETFSDTQKRKDNEDEPSGSKKESENQEMIQLVTYVKNGNGKTV